MEEDKMNPKYSYNIHLPDGLEQGRKYPVIFTFHGKGSNERNMFGLVAPLARGSSLLSGFAGIWHWVRGINIMI